MNRARLLSFSLLFILLTLLSPVMLSSKSLLINENIPLSFAPSREGTGFEVKTPGIQYHLIPGEIQIGINSEVNLRKIFSGANPTSTLTGENPTQGKINYFIGPDKTQWKSGLPLYSSVRYSDLYPGIDLVCRGTQKHLEYDLIVSPGSSPDLIRFSYSNADKIQINRQGELSISTKAGVLTEKAPRAWQEISGTQVPVKCSFHKTTNKLISFKLGKYNKNYPVIIDPVIYGTYLGGSSWDKCASVATDSAGNIYVLTNTQSMDFPLGSQSLFTTYYMARSYVVTKIDAARTQILLTVAIGNSDGCSGRGIGIDSSGSIYISGETYDGYPVTSNGYDTTHNGNLDAFVTKIHSSGTTIIYSTYLGGINADWVKGLAVWPDGSAAIGGYSGSGDLPTTPGTISTTYQGGSNDGYVAKFLPNGSLYFMTYLGGYANDQVSALTPDKEDESLFVTGYTYSTTFPVTAGVVKQTYNGGGAEAFITKLNYNGTNMGFSTFLGGTDSEFPQCINTNNHLIYVAGETYSTDYPLTAGAVDSTGDAASFDGFVTVLNNAATGYVYSTYLGGTATDVIYGVAGDFYGHIYLGGYTESNNFPLTTNAWDTVYGVQSRTFMTVINPNTGKKLFSSYVGGNYRDELQAMAFVSPAVIYLVGGGSLQSFPITSGAVDTLTGNLEGFLLGLNVMNDVGYTLTGDFSADTTVGINTLDVQFTTSIPGYSVLYEWDFGDGDTTTGIDPVKSYKEPGIYTVRLIVSNNYSTLTVTKPNYIRVLSEDTIQLPAVKMILKEDDIKNLYCLSDYVEDSTYDWTILKNYNDLTKLGRDTVSQSSQDAAATAQNIFEMWSPTKYYTGLNSVKFSTYRIKKLPDLVINPERTLYFNMDGYVSDLSGINIPESFASDSSLIYDDSVIGATWADKNLIGIKVPDTVTGDTKTTLDVIASTSELPNYWPNADMERFRVFGNRFPIGVFNTASTLYNEYGLELLPGLTGLPQISYVASTTDLAGVSSDNVYLFNINSTTQGIKLTPKFSNMLPYLKDEWYIARMKVCSLTPGNNFEAHLFHINGLIPGSPDIDLTANIHFGISTNWTFIDAPLYTHSTGIGYPQIIFKTGTSTGTIALGEIQVYKAAPLLMTTRSHPDLHYPARTFSSMSLLGWGWSTTEGTVQFGIMSSKFHLSFMNFDVATSGVQVGMKLTARGGGPGVYTPQSNPGAQVGMKADVSKMFGNFTTYGSLVLMACYGVPTSGSYDFWSPGGQLLASAQFGNITFDRHYVVGTSRNPYHQFQFMGMHNSLGILEFGDVDFLRDNDEPYFGDPDLIPLP